jgi:hypothetical protein
LKSDSSSPIPDRGRSAGALHVAILGTKGIPANYGGFETFAEQLATHLVARGHAVTVYGETAELPVADTFYQGVRIRYRRRPRWGAASVLAFDVSCLWDARKGYDLVYMLGYGAAWACWLPRLFGTPVWINVDGLGVGTQQMGSGSTLLLALYGAGVELGCHASSC